MIRLINVCRYYQTAASTIRALNHISLSIYKGQFTAITGPSGCGKTTLLNILAGYDNYQQGMIIWNGEVIRSSTEIRKMTAMIFQEFHLLPYLTVEENIRLPLRMSKEEMSDHELYGIMRKLGIYDWKDHYPNQLSGGQKQRAAIARVMVRKPKIVLADEPTGALDEENGATIMEILRNMQERGMTVIMVTHDQRLALMADRIINMERGHVVSERILVSPQTARH